MPTPPDRGAEVVTDRQKLYQVFVTLTSSHLRVQVYVLSRRVETIVLHERKSTCSEDPHRIHRAEVLPCQNCKVHLHMIISRLHVYRA